ncbi:unnamed protein product, partial [marine sediment metagenome]
DKQWQERFNAFKKEFGKLDHPDFHVYIDTELAGPTSPKSVEDLRLMEIENLVSFLKTWQPPEDPLSESPEALGLALSAPVVSEPERFAAEATRFKDVDPTYVRALLSGLNDAIKQGKVFPWSPVLDLCRWIIEQPREIPGRKGRYADLDPGWVWTRKTIAALLDDGFESETSQIPFALRSAAWDVLSPLTKDPDPTPEREERHGMDPATLAINTVRGEAMHAVLRYALWVRGHTKKSRNGKEPVTPGFDEMSEVREVLNHHLDPNNDSSLAIRA